MSDVQLSYIRALWFFMAIQQESSTAERTVVALDGTGGDNKDTRPVVDAVRFAKAMYPGLYLIIFGSTQLKNDLQKAQVDPSFYEFRLAQQVIPQDEEPRSVIKNYSNSAMVKAIECVKNKEADSMISSGGSGPLVALARHILGLQKLSDTRIKFKNRHGMVSRLGQVRPCFAARIPIGPNRFALMMDLGANANCQAQDLFDFACLGSAFAKISLELDTPRIALLNVGTEMGKGSTMVKLAKQYLEQDRNLHFTGFIEANRIFCDDADVIITDGFTGNVALKAAEGVADLYANATGLKKFFGKMARPEWLLPWQYNGSVLLGVNGLVIKSHASAGKEALAVAVVEAARAAHASLADKVQEELLIIK